MLLKWIEKKKKITNGLLLIIIFGIMALNVTNFSFMGMITEGERNSLTSLEYEKRNDKLRDFEKNPNSKVETDQLPTVNARIYDASIGVQKLFDSSTTEYMPSVFSDALERIWIIYSNASTVSSTDWDIYGRYSIDDGNTWSSPVTIVKRTGKDIGSSVVLDSDGTIWVFFVSEYANGAAFDVWVVNSTDNGGSWNTPFQITNSVSDSDFSVSAFVTLNGTMWVIFGTNRGLGDFNLYYTTSNDIFTTWNTPQAHPLSDGAIRQEMFDGAHVTPNGTIFISVDEVLGLWGSFIYKSSDNGASWTKHQATPYDQRFHGDIYINRNFDIHCLSVDTSNNLYRSKSTDGGSTWSSVESIPTGGGANYLATHYDPNGNLWIVFSSDRDGDWDIYYIIYDDFLDQEYGLDNQDTEGAIGYQSSTLYDNAQGFTPSISGTLTLVQLYARVFAGSPQGDIIVEIYSDNNGPTGSLLSNGTIPAFTSTSLTWVTCNFSEGVKLRAGEQYWIVARNPNDDGSNFYTWGYDSSSPNYSGGLGYQRVNGGSWTNQNRDWIFRTYLKPVHIKPITSFGGTGSGDGQFNTPYYVNVNDSGYIYVADTLNHRIQVFDSDYSFLFSWGSYGSGNGQFDSPIKVVTNSTGHVYVVDNWNSRVQVFTASGTYLMEFGNARLSNPCSMVINEDLQRIYVVDYFDDQICMYHMNGTYISSWGSSGSGDGQFSALTDITINKTGYIYTIEYTNHRIQVFDRDGIFITKSGSAGSNAGQFNHPNSIACDDNGNVFVSDSDNDRMQVFDGNLIFIAEFGQTGVSNGEFDHPRGVDFDTTGRIYVTDKDNHRIQVFKETSGFFELPQPNISPSINSPADIGFTEGETGHTITWIASDADLNPGTYNITRDGSLHREGVWNSSGETINVLLDGLTAGTYVYRCSIYDTDNETASDEVTVTVAIIGTPSITSPPDITYMEGDTGYEISWIATDTTPDPATYNITREGTLVAQGIWNSSGETIKISVDGLATGNYAYRCNVYDSAGHFAFNVVIVTVTTNNPPTIDSPLNINYFVGETGYTITWNPTDSDPSFYNITMDGSLIQEGLWNSSGEEITISVDGLLAGTYTYRCIVYDSIDQLAYDDVIVTVNVDPAPVIDHPSDITYNETSTGHFITWNPTDNNPSFYNITMDGSLIQEGLWNDSGEVITISVDGLSVGTYTYRCTVVDDHNQAVFDETIVTVNELEITDPSPPRELVGSVTSGQVTLNWDVPLSDGGAEITGYNIYRSTDSQHYTLRSSSVSTTFTDTTVGIGLTYYYVVTAVNSAGLESDFSNAVEAHLEQETTTTSTTTTLPVTGEITGVNFGYSFIINVVAIGLIICVVRKKWWRDR